MTDPDAARHRRASLFLVPTKTKGFERVRNIAVMGSPGSGWLSHSEVAYTDVVVDESAMLGARGEGFVMAQERLGPGRVHHCMRWLGICERAFDLMVAAPQRAIWDAAKRSVTAPSFKRGLPSLGPKSTRRGGWCSTQRGPSTAKAFAAARDSISLIKFHVAGVLGRVVDKAVQTHGALGLTDDLPLAFFYGHERAARIYDGPDEVHKISYAKRLLKRVSATIGAEQ